MHPCYAFRVSQRERGRPMSLSEPAAPIDRFVDESRARCPQLQANPGTAHPQGSPLAHSNPQVGTRAHSTPVLAHSGHIGVPMACACSRVNSTINPHCWHLYL
jgi:hypothetical protein